MRYSQFLRDLILDYNQEPESLEKRCQAVGETEESRRKRYQDSREPMIFQATPHGSFWVIEEDSSTHWLFPKANLTINEFNYITIKHLFECRGYREGYPKNFRVLRPAKLALILGTNLLEHEARGIIEFEGSAQEKPLEERLMDLESGWKETEELLRQNINQNLQNLEYKIVELQTIKDFKATLDNYTNLLNELQTSAQTNPSNIPQITSGLEKKDRQILIGILSGIIIISVFNLLGLINNWQQQGNLNYQAKYTKKLEDSTGRNIVDFLEQKKITIKAQGQGIPEVSLEVCRQPDVENNLTVLIPSGTIFKPDSEQVASLISTDDRTVTLSNNQCVDLTIPAMSMKMSKSFPQAEDSLSVKKLSQERSPIKDDLKKLISRLEKATDNLSYSRSLLTQQAAIWLITDDPSYIELKNFKSFLPHSREIRYVEKIDVDQSKSGYLEKTDEENPTRSNTFKDDYLLTSIPVEQRITIRLNSSNFDTYLQIIDAKTGDVIDYNDDSGSRELSKIELRVNFRVDYLIRITSYGKRQTGSYNLTVTSQEKQQTSQKLMGEKEAALAMKIIDEAEIDIKQKSIWQSRDRIQDELDDARLKEWLQQRKLALQPPLKLN